MVVEVNGKKVSYEVIGNGEPLLLVHGWSGTRNSLRKLAAHLAGDFKCYLIDMPGRGDSENPDPDWGTDEYAKHLIAFINTVIKQPTNYFGHSFGGTLGVYLASTTKLIKKLVLSAPSYRREGRKAQGTTQVKESRIKGFLKKFKNLRRLYYKIFHPASEFLKLEHLQSNFVKVTSSDQSDKLKNITADTLIIWGVDDIDTPLYQAYILNRGISRSILKVYSGYGHELAAYYPDVFAEDVKLFLKRK